MFKGPLITKKDYLHAWKDSLFLDHAIFRLVWTNFSPVIEEKVYRSNHPTPRRLKKMAETYQLKTLINLRGHRMCGSDALSRQASQDIKLSHIDMAFESRGAPHRDRILRFSEIYKTIEFPMLMHCKSGADRAGLASGLVILFEGGRAADALKQLHWQFGHFNRSRTGILDAFFYHYMNEAEGKIPFLEWVTYHYNEKALYHSFTTSKLSSFMVDRVLKRE
ncbi:protein-tyrosine phosphatase family protein [Entomobacter blattae]|uniref:Protein tyrosine phosphatase n=1 Tax=Entomobacter blattae TaxID=2762277 RepID=A0A7H1NPH3_9PROT|nr:tyrosine-protein phosphatase [Entomobacter blattae]QNT77683.1 hypothetical protein JGUZn3_04330 [Entomobacter blattae]